MEFGEETTNRSRLPFISLRPTNNPGLKSHFTISPGSTRIYQNSLVESEETPALSYKNLGAYTVQYLFVMSG
jgi:hypothetical protein